MMDELEREMDCPDDWTEDIIYVKDGRGEVIEIEVPDDQEEE